MIERKLFFATIHSYNNTLHSDLISEKNFLEKLYHLLQRELNSIFLEKYSKLKFVSLMKIHNKTTLLRK